MRRTALGVLSAGALTAPLLLLMPAAPAGASTAQATPAPSAFTLTLLHNNDGESSLLPAAPRGGIARYGTIVNGLRAQASTEGSSSLLVSSGDNYLAGPQLQASLDNFDGDIDYSDDGPFYDAKALDTLGYDASAIGNHEFDFGPKVTGFFLSQFKTSNIRFVSANLDVTGEAALNQFSKPSPGEKGSLVTWTRTVKDGRKIAIVGATTSRLPSVTSPGADVTARENVLEAVQAAIDAATADGTNVVVLISHLQNITEDQALIKQLKKLDIAVAGGGDELLANPTDPLLAGTKAEDVFGSYPLLAKDADGVDVPIVTTEGSYGYVGRLIVSIDAAGVVTKVDPRSGPVRNAYDATTPPADQAIPDPTLLETVEKPVAAFVAGLVAQDVATTAVKLDGVTASVRSGETNLGSLFADALRRTAEKGAPAVFGAENPTVAIQNSGGIRNSLELGPDVNRGKVTAFDTFRIAPFTNFVGYTTGVTPRKLKALLERSVSAGLKDGALQPEGRFGQWSGLRFVYDPSKPAQVVSRADDGSVAVTTEGQRVRQVFLTRNTTDTADDVQVVRNGVVVSNQAVDLAANSFTVGQNGDNYPFNLSQGQFVNLPTTYQQSLAARFAELGTVTAAAYPVGGLGRITVGGDAGATFTDVPTGGTFFTEIGVIAQAGITTGYGDGTFRPQLGVSRTQMASFLFRRAAPEFTAPATPTFSDVPIAAPAYREIEWLASQGITLGSRTTDGVRTFDPAGVVNRGQMAAFLYRAAKATAVAPAKATFTDVPVGGIFFTEIEWAAANKVTTGLSGGSTYGPGNGVSRGQMAAFLVRSGDLSGQSS